VKPRQESLVWHRQPISCYYSLPPSKCEGQEGRNFEVGEMEGEGGIGGEGREGGVGGEGGQEGR